MRRMKKYVVNNVIKPQKSSKQVIRPPSSASSSGTSSIEVTQEEILFTKRASSAASTQSRRSNSGGITSSSEKPREDVEAVLDFTEEEILSGDYYENVVFQTGKKSLDQIQSKLENNEEYEEVLVSTVPFYENVNYSNQNETKKNEDLYTIGRRFPSIRVKDKKTKKKEQEKKEKEVKTIDYNVSKEEYSTGSCAQPVSAIYGTLDNSEKLSNIYENGHIILRQQQRQNSNSKWKRICKESKPVLAVILVSFVVFITAGAILLYQSLNGTIAVAPRQFVEWRRPSTVPSTESWGEWSSWSQCSEQCLPGESQARTRQCLRSDGEPSDDLTNCKVTEGGPSNIEIQRCICPSYIETAVSKNDNTSSEHVRYCDSCDTSREVCVALTEDIPVCHKIQDPLDPTGCGGLCILNSQVCLRIDTDAFKCENALNRVKKSLVAAEEMNVSLLKLNQMKKSCFECGNLCLDLHQVCNGVVDCDAQEDEMYCKTTSKGVEDDAENLISSCHKGMFRCASDLHCIQTEAFCDQHLDCIDGSDEPQGCNKL